MIYVQHLLGIGHLIRITRIADELSRNSFDVTLVSGGVPVAGLHHTGVRVVQLDPVKIGEDGFSTLVRADGKAFGSEDRSRRCAHLLETFDTVAPDVLITEAFPFGRRQMRFELLPLLDRARRGAMRPSSWRR